mmetsp:Transcript_64017/g.143054  ORF Transcript_64017/g.143054 Transcript_64017/m.143054 type:complete len:99 (-) Transcript_64017:542-838(-)
MCSIVIVSMDEPGSNTVTDHMLLRDRERPASARHSSDLIRGARTYVRITADDRCRLSDVQMPDDDSCVSPVLRCSTRRWSRVCMPMFVSGRPKLLAVQ